MFDGIQEKEINGVKRGFKFGGRAIALAEREDGCKAGEIFKKIADGDQLALLNLFYGAASDYCKVKGIDQDFNSSDVSDWVYIMGFDEAMTLFNEGMKAYEATISKNLKAPAQTGA